MPMRYGVKVLSYLSAYKALAVATLGAVVLVTLANLLAPWPMKVLIDSVLGDHPLPGILTGSYFAEHPYVLIAVVVAAGFLIVLLQNGLQVFREYVNTQLKLRITLDFRVDLFQHAQRLSMAYHDSTYSGNLVYLLNNQADAVAGLIMTVPTLAQSLLTFIGMFLVVVFIDAQLALVSLLVLPFLFYSVRSYSSRIHQPLHRVKDLESQTLSMIQEAMSMLRVVVAFGREKHELNRFRAQGREALDARVDVTVRQSLFELTVNLITAGGVAFVVGLGAVHITHGTLTVGELLVVMAYISTIYQSLGTISSTVGSLQDQLVSIERAFEVLETDPDVSDRPGVGKFVSVRGSVAFEGVSFSYDGQVGTLSDISFRVEPGEFVAIIGPTGAGKTTLVSLIPRFYDPGKGRIMIDSTDIRDHSIESLRRQISIVGQDPLLFVGTVAENIRYGRLEASHAAVMEAARAANAHEFIQRLPDGYETLVGERGARLSGGERQRISIARAFLKNAPILILDEPTAFIDPKTEGRVLEALNTLRLGRTTFMISHRPGTISEADKILVIEQGRITEMGSHEDLLSGEGLYGEFRSILEKQVHT